MDETVVVNDDSLEKNKKTQDDLEIPAIEGNVVCALFVLISGIVLDALCANPGTLLADVPASMRTTSLVLAVLLGSPSISKSQSYIIEQRIVLAALLSIAAFFGMNEAEVTARNADGLFSLVGALACVVACATNGIMLQFDTPAKRRESREHLAALTGAFLFYIGMRCLRNGFALPSNVLSFSVSNAEFNVRGYAISNELTVLGFVFAGSVIASFGIIVLLNHDLVIHTGSQGLSTVSAILACCAFVGAFAVQISTFSLMEQLPALFSDAACGGEYEYCQAAYRSRRFFVATNNSSVAWIGTIAISTFAFSNVRRFTVRRDHFLYFPNFLASTSIAVLLSALVSITVVFLFVDINRSMNFADLELALLLLSLPTALLSFSSSSCVLHIAGQAIYVLTRMDGENGFTMLYFTHHSIVATLVLTILVFLTSSSSYFLYTFRDSRLYSEILERTTGAFLTMLLSVQIFLTIATMGMSSGYTGIRYSDDKGSYRISGYEFSVQHSISFFFAAALYATRYEPSMLSARERRGSWFVVPPILGLTWMICVLTLSDKGSPYQEWVNLGSFLIGISSAVCSWAGVGVFLHT